MTKEQKNLRTIVALLMPVVIAFLWMLWNQPTGDGDNSSTSLQPAAQSGSIQWVVSRHERDRYLDDVKKRNEHITLEPVAGTTRGSIRQLIIASLSTDSPMYQAGLREGDKILTVNSSPIGTMKRAINLVHEVRTAELLTVVIERNNELQRFRIEFK